MTNAFQLLMQKIQAMAQHDPQMAQEAQQMCAQIAQASEQQGARLGQLAMALADQAKFLSALERIADALEGQNRILHALKPTMHDRDE